MSVHNIKGNVSQLPVVDSTLTRSGYSADAKATGDAIEENKQRIEREAARLDSELDVERGKIDQIANNQIPVEYLEAAVDAYVEENTAGLATQESLETVESELKSDLNQLQDVIGIQYLDLKIGNFNGTDISSESVVKNVAMSYLLEGFGNCTFSWKENLKVTVFFGEDVTNVQNTQFSGAGKITLNGIYNVVRVRVQKVSDGTDFTDEQIKELITLETSGLSSQFTEKLKTLGETSRITLTTEILKNGYVQKDSNFWESESYRTTKPIYFNAGDVLNVTATGTGNISVISKTIEDGSKYEAFVLGGSTNYTIIIPNDGYYCFSYRYSDLFSVTVSKTTLSNGIKDVSTETTKRIIKTDRLFNNKLVESMAHQGITFGYGQNAQSSFWGGYLKGFDTMLANIVWTSDGVPVCDHDGYFTDSITKNEIVISNVTYEQLSACRRKGEVVPKFEDVMYLSKVLGMPVMCPNAPESYETSKWNTLWGIIDKYRMAEHMSWIVGDDEAIELILSHNPKQRILKYMRTFSLDEIQNFVNSVNALADRYPNSEFIVWLPTMGYEINDVVTGITSVNASLKNNVKMGVCNITEENYLNLLPYIDVFHSDYITSGNMVDVVKEHLAEKYPQISPFKDRNLMN